MGPPNSVLDESILDDNSSQRATQPLNYSQDSEAEDQSMSQEDKVPTLVTWELGTVVHLRLRYLGWLW